MKTPNLLSPYQGSESLQRCQMGFGRGRALSIVWHFGCIVLFVARGLCAEAQVPAGALPSSQAKAETAPSKRGVELLSLSWLFHPTRPSLSTLTTLVPHAEFQVPAGSGNSFTVKLAVALKSFDGPKTIFEIPGIASVVLRQHDPLDRNRQNYPAFKMPDGSAPVLEATVVLHSLEHPNWTNMTIGIPLAMLARPEGEHEIILHFSGVDWKMFVDGELLDNDFPYGYPEWPEKSRSQLDPEYVREATLYRPGIEPEKRLAVPRTAPEIQYWLPAGHNNWVGDVETCFFQGRYHVFYLYDRRHHQSKFGCGAHYLEHFSTTDFRTWIEHEAATPLEQQWECIGTGVPFEFKNQLCLSYGWHTTRVYPEEKTTLPAQRAYLKENGYTARSKPAWALECLPARLTPSAGMVLHASRSPT
jgi:hypothetical protein